VEATHRPTCKHGYSGQCGGIRIRYLNGSTTTRSLEDHQNVTTYFEGYNITFYSWVGSSSQSLICYAFI
jgi:hypothetical protein